MFTRMGEQIVYHNFAVGCAKHPEDDESMYLVFTDNDNEETHMFSMKYSEIDVYIQTLKDTRHAHKLHIAGAHEMPR